MGNRAVVKFKTGGGTEAYQVYLHWNGGPESIAAFLRTLELRGWTRPDYCSARFVAVVGEFFDMDGTNDGLSLGVFPADHDMGPDHAPYVVTLKDGKFLIKQDKSKAVNCPDLASKGNYATFDKIVEALSRLRAQRKILAKQEE